MSEKKAWVVMGDTGEYSDHHSWYLKVFLHQEPADALCERLNAWCREKGCSTSGLPWEQRHGEKQMLPPEDPNFQNDYTGTMYSVMELPLEIAKTIKVVT